MYATVNATDIMAKQQTYFGWLVCSRVAGKICARPLKLSQRQVSRLLGGIKQDDGAVQPFCEEKRAPDEKAARGLLIVAQQDGSARTFDYLACLCVPSTAERNQSRSENS